MDDFVHIVPAFTEEADRTLERLHAVYTDSDRLQELIRSVMQPHLASGMIEHKRVLLKPNWVKHNMKALDEICMRTHDNFLLAALEVVLDQNPGSVLIGDAPIQGCRWDRMISSAFEQRVKELSDNYRIPVAIKDFRRVTFDPSKDNPIRERNPLSDYVIMDLGEESFLEPITRADKQVFRVTNYNPDRFTESHAPGVHKYCITKELFAADVVISLPKVKTHQKAGITAALKNIVGLNGDKDFLPHHRLGGTGYGGDCYPGKNRLRYWAELAMDFANRRQGKFSYWVGQKLSSLLWRLSFPDKEHQLAAGWHGNDTTWRMVLDLNRIVLYGRPDGSVADSPQRQLFSLCDGIVGGQGDGPLKPDPLPLGVVSFTNHSTMNDVAMAALMGFDIDRIPMLKTALAETENRPAVQYDGRPLSWQDLRAYAIAATPPPGWEAYFNQMTQP